MCCALQPPLAKFSVFSDGDGPAPWLWRWWCWATRASALLLRSPHIAATSSLGFGGGSSRLGAEKMYRVDVAGCFGVD